MSKLLNVALSQFGVKEYPGEQHNPQILEYFKAIGQTYSDETAWCSAFMNWCAKQAGLECSDKLNARSWLKVETKVEQPSIGDVVVFWREDVKSWKGHVAIYINQQDLYINVLGGNQNNMVCIKSYPAHRLLGYRRLGG